MRCSSISRRRFLKQSIHGAGLLAGSGSVFKSAAGAESPFAYDVERLRKTDPKLVGYEQVGRFPVPNSRPRRIAFGGPENRLYVAAGSSISVLELDGTRCLEFALAGPARAVAVAGDGTIYTGLRDHVEVFSAKGKRLASWDSPGQRTWFTGLAAGENDLFAADAGNRVVLRYDKSGKLAGRIGEKDREKNIPGLIVPSPYLQVQLARDGLLRVNNPGRHRVEVYTISGDLELFWGKPSAGIAGFCGCCNPIGLAILPDGRCATCEKGLPRVKVYSTDGTFESVVAGSESFPENARNGAIQDKSDGMLGGLDAAVDTEGRIFVLDLVAADVRVMKRKA
jgi:hypothetical protein